MDPLYLMQALGLDTPILEAIHGNLFSTHLFRSIFTLFLELGFSLIHTEKIYAIACTEYTFRQNGRRQISCLLMLSDDHRHVFASLSTGEETPTEHLLEYKNNQTEIVYKRQGQGISDKGFPNEIMLEMWKERVITLTRIINRINT